MSQYLLEIGLEELPARFIPMLSQQLEDLTSEFLKEKRLAYQSIEKFATPRRLAVRVNGLAQSQEDISSQLRGPSLKIAKDENGEWTKAAHGFAKGQGGSPDDLIIKEVKGEEYVFYEKFEKGLPAKLVLEEIDQVVQKLQAPVSMRWNNYKTEYIRPVHWLVSLLDDEVVPFEFVAVKAGRLSRGHRFLGEDQEIKSASSYEAQLEDQFVIPSFSKRQDMIKAQIQELCQKNNWQVPIDLDLLEEVTGIVEYPTAFWGEFEEEYLKIPEIILVTAMRDHQRYFPVYDRDTNELLAYFISVRNGDDKHLENVVSGNQKVLKARLEDALFFYEDDIKHDIDYFNKQLKTVNEHAKIGSLQDKQDRVEQLVNHLSNQITNNLIAEEDIKAAQEASKIYKFDLMTGVVNEFSELQGQIGAIYAQKQGLSDKVCQAIKTQYLPDQSGGALPDTDAGSLLALADKFDSLINFFKVGIIPTGSNDPYALRRQATGIVEILLDKGWKLALDQFLTSDLLKDSEDEGQLRDDLIKFILARLEKHLKKDGVDHDIISAVIESNSYDIVTMNTQAHYLKDYKDKDRPAYNSFVESLSRVVNLGIKVDELGQIDETLSQTESEKTLISSINEMPDNKDQEAKFNHIKNMTQTIASYFEENMVNHEDELIKNNRLNTLGQLTRDVMTLMDPRQLISKGN